MRGRKPKPLAELERAGTFRANRHAHLRAGGADFPPIPTEPPDCLDDYGRAVWTCVIESMSPGHLTAVEMPLLVCYANSMGLYKLAMVKIREEGIFARRKTTSAGAVKGAEKDTPSRWYRIARESLADALRVATLLGLTAVDRNRVTRVSSPAPSPAATRPRSALDGLGPIRLTMTDGTP